MTVWERMGPGGPRGLQILRSGASRVRGGFDSHTFPPFAWTLLGVLAVTALSMARAPGVEAGAWHQWKETAWVRAAGLAEDDSTGAEADSSDVPEEDASDSTDSAPDSEPIPVPGAPGEVRAQRALVPTPVASSRFEQPRWVMLRSLVLPGWGQVHNHAWLKAALVVAGEGTLGYRVVNDRRNLSRLKREADAALLAGNQTLQFDLLDQHNALVDASVSRQWVLGGVLAFALLDAYIDAHFRNFRIEFETDPALPQGEGTTTGMRLKVRTGF